MARWEEAGVYRFDRTRDRADVYAIDTPPPTVSGSLHVGHVFSYTHTDVIARFQRMRGQGRLLSDGMGRQRPADRAARAELFRRPLRSVAAVRPVVSAAGQAGEAADLGFAAELHRAVRAADRRRREGVRGALAVPRAVGRLVDDLRDDRPARPAHFAGGVPAAAAQGAWRISSKRRRCGTWTSGRPSRRPSSRIASSRAPTTAIRFTQPDGRRSSRSRRRGPS